MAFRPTDLAQKIRDMIPHVVPLPPEAGTPFAHYVANRRIGMRLAELLSTIHAGNPAVFVPQEMTDRVTQTFGFVLSVAGMPGMLPPEG